MMTFREMYDEVVAFEKMMIRRQNEALSRIKPGERIYVRRCFFLPRRDDDLKEDMETHDDYLTPI